MNWIKASTLLLVVLLSGCLENRKNTDKLCADNPALQCEKLNINDGQCRVARTDLIWHRYEVLSNPSVKNKITEYQLTTTYRKCLELAAQIQLIDQAELTQRRFSALINSGEELKRLTQELHQLRTPEALYFLWSQTGDQQARREFLRLEGRPELDNAEMQYALATFYTTRDREKTIHLLIRALELSPPRQVNPEIFQSLASTYQTLGQKENAYLWAMIGKEFGVSVASQSELKLMYSFTDAKFSQLDGLADQLAKAIRKGEFTHRLVPSS
ncbi:DUF2989 domain-containing protein [Vibrio cincinnatiensis]|uniref:DUF2989 domain-containing protein n=1 Tax=Vibrio cincinnatiensis DSM 19608 TaxID=1123491 RepID=A0A1T4M976_VIBCI|nr:DUF2989 domain-containing protein [Vibrio cincinnatiensis]MCG3723116.1 DUF2989 domain-containing protein [Vibrio cincinnatiensis]MCG3724843.1 DUF2989 domain-containing protein [Vibrio cincinnatiensis]MCG3731601.1 DUF2989 domain-containing protein [Vibrio cincinnatiensis]MCG3738414.1 DUF2989 domain-containing protein [Vibrio cincinnatiensis]MCG3744794.1 DUF2989 domain-containing protein [Vibrio cincinnatiensis]